MNNKNDKNTETSYTPKQLKQLKILMVVLGGINLSFSLMIIKLGNLKMGLSFIGMLIFFTAYMYINFFKRPNQKSK